jgi:hypothetical protein
MKIILHALSLSPAYLIMAVRKSARLSLLLPALLAAALTSKQSVEAFVLPSSCSTAPAAVKNFHVGITTSSSSSSLFSSEEPSTNEYDSEFNLEGGDDTGTGGIPQQAPAASQQKLDPLIASLTRIDEPTPANVPMRSVPLFGEVPADGNLALLLPAAGIAILGFLFSIVVAFNARDEIVSELSKVELPKMEYTPTKVEEGKCRGLCSSQEDDLDGLRNFMEGISRKAN